MVFVTRLVRSRSSTRSLACASCISPVTVPLVVTPPRWTHVLCPELSRLVPPSVVANFNRAPYFVDKILKGAKPADIPVEQPTKFDLVINLKTTKALGLTILQSLLVRADEIIQ
jgi:hypothetical protein